MISVGGHTTGAKQNQRFQAADILVGIPYLRHIIIVIPAAGRSAFAAEGDELFFFRMYFINQRFKGNVVKVHVGDSSKQSFNEQLIGVFRRLGIAVRCTGKTDQSTGKLILQSGDIRLFPADTGFRTALATCSLFTLKTKHLSIQLHFLLMLLR